MKPLTDEQRQEYNKILHSMKDFLLKVEPEMLRARNKIYEMLLDLVWDICKDGVEQQGIPSMSYEVLDAARRQIRWLILQNICAKLMCVEKVDKFIPLESNLAHFMDSLLNSFPTHLKDVYDNRRESAAKLTKEQRKQKAREARERVSSSETDQKHTKH